MRISYNVDKAIDCIKNIIDSIRCGICDKPEGDRVRFYCGHTACDDCAAVNEDCLICLVPSQTTSHDKFVHDEPLSQRVKNALLLLNSFQEAFHIDVYQRRRISTRLKIEKELFPECIQAPATYYNKRKSSYSFSKNKENRRPSSFPGEHISSSKNTTMERTKKYVHEWLNKSTVLPRKPLADLNVNQQSSNIQEVKVRKTRFSPLQKLKTKRQSQLSEYIRSLEVERNCTENEKTFDHNEKYIKNDKDESGIEIEDEFITIDDSQSSVIDKDKNALLAIVEADKYDQTDFTSVDITEHRESTNDIAEHDKTFANANSPLSPHVQVPFYKKSKLFELCQNCRNAFEKKNSCCHISDQPKDVLILVENDNYITTIKVCHNNSDRKIKKSAIVQTDACEVTGVNLDSDSCKSVSSRNGLKRVVDIESKDIPTKKSKICHQNLPVEEKEVHENFTKTMLDVTTAQILQDKTKELQNISNAASCVVIEESDSDIDTETGSLLQVTAEVHRSSDQMEDSVLKEIENPKEHETRPRPAPRGNTPDSSNSSEKENFDPNRSKTRKSGKKYNKQKHGFI